MILVLLSHLYLSWLILKNNFEQTGKDTHFIPESIANYIKSLNSQLLHENSQKSAQLAPEDYFKSLL